MTCRDDYSRQSYLKSRPPSFPFLHLKLVNKAQLNIVTKLWTGTWNSLKVMEDSPWPSYQARPHWTIKMPTKFKWHPLCLGGLIPHTLVVYLTKEFVISAEREGRWAAFYPQISFLFYFLGYCYTGNVPFSLNDFSVMSLTTKKNTRRSCFWCLVHYCVVMS